MINNTKNILSHPNKTRIKTLGMQKYTQNIVLSHPNKTRIKTLVPKKCLTSDRLSHPNKTRIKTLTTLKKRHVRFIVTSQQNKD